jgi:hypothetical protein
MSLQSRIAGAQAQGAVVCAECGAEAAGNFCSVCGADLREGMLGMLGAAAGTVRRSFPAVYLGILRAPVRTTVELAEDPTYRSHVSFLLTGIALFCLLFLPILMRTTVPVAAAGHMSEDMQTLMKVLSQVGVYVGAVITFVLAFALFRYFAKEPRTLKAYFKLYCIAFGFVMPLYAVYEFAMRGLFGGTGMSSFSAGAVRWTEPSTLLSAALALVLWSYFIAIHRRFWRMSLWRAGALYVVAAIASNQLSFLLMYVVGYWTTKTLIAAGLVKV